jgi:hypothetical protein
VLLKRRIFALKRNSLPPITTHNMADDANDPILNQVWRCVRAPRETLLMTLDPSRASLQ